MKRYGKLDVFGDLVIAGNTIQNNTEIIVNPTDEEYTANGYKLVVFDKALADKKGFNVEKYYEENESCIYVRYRYVDNTETTDIDDRNLNLNPIDVQ